MIGAQQYILTWDHFEELHQDTQVVFEKLCRSLFLRKFCLEDTILHSDPNHPGVEVAPALSKQSKYISFQSKYFELKIDYAQIERSAKQTVKHYKDTLDIVYLFSNKDITESSKSYQNVKEIYAGANIEVVLVTGNSILELATEYPTVLSCYFGLDCLDQDWFERNIDLSLQNLGRRYNPRFNIDTEAQRNLSIFLREKKGLEKLNDKKELLLLEIENKRYQLYEHKEILNIAEKLYSIVSNIADVDESTINDVLEWKNYLLEQGSKYFDKLESVKKEVEEVINETRANLDESEYKVLRGKIDQVNWLLSLPCYLECENEELTCITNKVVVVKGEMGTGKSQLLATAAKRLVDCKRPALLLLGQTYVSEEEIGIQIIKGLGGLAPDQSFEALIEALDEKAFLAHQDAAIFIDAINESGDYRIWKEGINKLIECIYRCKNVRMIISLRSGFEKLVLSESVIERIENRAIAVIEHRGLFDESLTSIYDFLSNYGIPFSPEYYLREEMTNPLFLTWFCQTDTGKEQELIQIIKKILQKADEEGSIAADFKEPIGMLEDFLDQFIELKGDLSLKAVLSLPVWGQYGVPGKKLYIKALERFGILTSYIRDKDEMYYIGYNFLAEYVEANNILNKCKEKDDVKKYCIHELFAVDEKGNVTEFGKESLFAMVSVLYAEKYEEECIDVLNCIEDEWEKSIIVKHYIRAFTWRSSHISLEHFFDIVQKYSLEPEIVWDVFIENSTKENSELNASGLDSVLKKYELNRRDYLWTKEINAMDEDDRIVSLVHYIENGKSFKMASEKSVELLLMLFSWMLSSSNRVLRDRVSKAMIELLKDHFQLCQKLLESFIGVNDPYIIQRLFGVVFGAVVKRTREFNDEYCELVKFVYTEIFDNESVYPDILLRDYARLIIERFIFERPEEAFWIDDTKIRPPYKSECIPIVEVVDYTNPQFSQRGLDSLLYSMKFNYDVKGIGFYGDFGRYIFQAAVNHFYNVDVSNVYYYALKYILEELDYSTEYFGEYDYYRLSFSDRAYNKKTERIGKKYQWIAMYNILARLSDHYKLKGWNLDKEYDYEGPWDPYVRDFDPTLNLKIKPKDELIKLDIKQYGEGCFISPTSDELDVERWQEENDQMFLDFPERLVLIDDNGNEWISLYLFQENKFQIQQNNLALTGNMRGSQNIWSIASMYIVAEKDSGDLEQAFSSSNFMQEIPDRPCYTLFSREYAWSPGYKSVFSSEEESVSELRNVFPASINVLFENEYDASIEETTSLIIPTGDILQKLGLFEKEFDGIYYYKGDIAAVDLFLLGYKNHELILRRDLFELYINKTHVTVFWKVIGEKQFFWGNGQTYKSREGYFVYNNGKIEGEIK